MNYIINTMRSPTHPNISKSCLPTDLNATKSLAKCLNVFSEKRMKICCTRLYSSSPCSPILTFFSGFSLSSFSLYEGLSQTLSSDMSSDIKLNSDGSFVADSPKYLGLASLLNLGHQPNHDSSHPSVKGPQPMMQTVVSLNSSNSSFCCHYPRTPLS